MKKALLYYLVALLSIYSSATARAFQEGNASAAKTAQDATQAEQPCVGKSGEKLKNIDAEANSFAASFGSFTTDVVRIVEAAANPSDGLDEAQKLMDAQKPALKTQFLVISNGKNCQLSKEVRKNLTDSMYQSSIKFHQLKAKHESVPVLKTKFQKLSQDFMEILKREGEPQAAGNGRGGNMKSPDDSAKSNQPCLSKTGEPLEKKDAEINSFVDAIDAFTDELVKQVEAAPNPSAGTDEAQKYMDTEKVRMRALFASVMNIQECQVSPEAKKRMQDHFYQDGFKMGQLQTKYGDDPAVSAKLQKLTQDFLDLFKVQPSGS